MRLTRRLAVLGVALGLLAAACSPSAPGLPAGAQLIHLTVAPAVLSIEPTSGHPGNVYVALDEPTSLVLFVQGSDGSSLRPLTQGDIDRLAKGDQQGTSSEPFELSGCDAPRRAADRGKVRTEGGCGNIFVAEHLQPGLYAFLGEDPATLGPGESVRMVVLTIVR